MGLSKATVLQNGARNTVFMTCMAKGTCKMEPGHWGERSGGEREKWGEEYEGPPRAHWDQFWSPDRWLCELSNILYLWILLYLLSASCRNALPLCVPIYGIMRRDDLSLEFSEGNLTLFKNGHSAVKPIFHWLTAPCCCRTQAIYNVCPKTIWRSFTRELHMHRLLSRGVCRASWPLQDL